MLTLRSSPPSPFGRKVKIAAKVLGLWDGIDVVTTDTADPNDSIRRQNPLGKIPALILENGRVLFDSPVILEYLDHVAGGGRIIPSDAARFDVLTQQALGDGILDAAILLVYERRWREADKHEPKWIAHQHGKVERSLAALEAAPPAAPTALPDAGQITIACALGYLDLRFDGAWRAHHPKLVAWLAAFEKAVPAFAETAPA
ncbi:MULTISPECIES: glutathione S-transferase family protein [unclassified Chelatococcus]|uniref:glutathione S-transferase family protein n=1 Tax=unclassified Chelatococcus TaxID=2638111 RepID=UPI001BCCE773|nr:MULTISPECIES: glutathione S-transferase family protein [unclassified Chelatococcus]MBS7697783.1 glutathione S-transferase family protein [Chelatococcus sp. YT9]MBX3559722.1 glutathione S-transferase family protein [Chelatococcus sp.]